MRGGSNLLRSRIGDQADIVGGGGDREFGALWPRRSPQRSCSALGWLSRDGTNIASTRLGIPLSLILRRSWLQWGRRCCGTHHGVYIRSRSSGGELTVRKSYSVH